MLPGVRPLWVICEDGTEYHDRFTRFLDAEFRFVHAADATALLRVLAEDQAAGVILDLDFRRTPRERLVDEQGRAGAQLPDAERRRLAAIQGILILRLLRCSGVPVPVVLCADLDDPGQAAYLEQTLGPLQIAPGHEGLLATAERMRGLGGQR